MMTSNLPHGGALQAAMAQYGGSAEDWLDLSTGINPNAAPIPLIGDHCFARLPEWSVYRATLDAAARYYGASGQGLLAAGTQPIIALLPHLIGNRKAQILGPTYGEYAGVMAAHDLAFEHIASLDEATAPWVIVINPDNPSTRLWPRKALLTLARNCAAKGGCLVVDEAFGDLQPEHSLAQDTGREGLMVLRSFGKFFGLAGLRLAAAFGADAAIQRMQKLLGPWPVSGPALAIGHALYDDFDLHRRIKADIAQCHDLTRNALENVGLIIAGDAGLFILVDHERAAQLHQALARCHVLTRAFDYAPRWLRFGLCKDEEEVKILIQRLKVSVHSLA